LAIDLSGGQITVDLDAAIAAAGIGYSSNFRIKFQQYDDETLPGDWRVWDNVVVFT